MVLDAVHFFVQSWSNDSAMMVSCDSDICTVCLPRTLPSCIVTNGQLIEVPSPTESISTVPRTSLSLNSVLVMIFSLVLLSLKHLWNFRLTCSSKLTVSPSWLPQVSLVFYPWSSFFDFRSSALDSVAYSLKNYLQLIFIIYGRFSQADSA